MGDGGGGHWLVRMEWHPAGWSVCLPLLIFPCTIKSGSSLLTPAYLGGPRERAVKWLCVCIHGASDFRAVKNGAAGFSQDQAAEHPSDPRIVCSDSESDDVQSQMASSASADNSSRVFHDNFIHTDMPAIHQSHPHQTITASGNTVINNASDNTVINIYHSNTPNVVHQRPGSEYEVNEVSDVPR